VPGLNSRESAPYREPIKVIGWREWIGLPEIGIASIRAKVDTGARTSALHACDLHPYEKDGAHWIDFRVPQAGLPKEKRCSALIIDERDIKNTSGQVERRYVVETTLVVGVLQWRAEFSLANRETMAFEVILGRAAIRRHALIVDPGKSFLAGPPHHVARAAVGNP
jgi:hypothetical protein